MDAMLDGAPCGFLVFNDQGIITTINRTLAQWLGYAAEELAGKKFEALMGIAGRIFFQTHFFPLITLQGQAQEIFMSLYTKEKAELPMLVNAKRNATDGAPENHCVLMPVPQRKKYESELLHARRAAEETIAKNERLQEATDELEASKISLDRQVTQLSLINEDLTKFSKVISHDMQEPVRKIAMFADVISRERERILSPGIQHAAERIATASNRMRTLISCLEQYMGIDISSDTPAACDLNGVIEAARLKAEAVFEKERIHIAMSGLPAVIGRRAQLEQLFYQLIANAVQFKKAGAPVTEIRIEADVIQQNSYRSLQDKYRYVDFVRIVFSDEGRGFPAEYGDYVFQLFKKAHEDGEGLGFGLALCKKIIDNHYGYISAKSQTGKGATITLLLPAGAVEGRQ